MAKREAAMTGKKESIISGYRFNNRVELILKSIFKNFLHALIKTGKSYNRSFIIRKVTVLATK